MGDETCKMYNNIGSTWYRTGIIARHVEMACQPIENLSGIGEICLQGVDIYCGVRKWHNVEIENFVTFTQEVGNNVFSSFS